MKIETDKYSFVYDLVNHMRGKGMTDEMSEYLRNLLEDNITMHIKIEGKLYSAPWKYWRDYVSAFNSCCGCCDLECFSDMEVTKKELLKHSVELKDSALDY